MPVRDPDRARVWRAALSVALATAAYGVSFGALATASGLSVAQACVLSLVLFSGGSQFAIVGVIAAGGVGAGGAAIAGAALLGVRNLFYSVRMSPIIGPGSWRRIAAAHLTIDESTAVGTAQPTPSLQRLGFWVTGLGVFLGWNATTLVGALLGDLLGDVRGFGLDAAASAAFLGLLWPRLRQRQALAVACASAVIAVVAVPWLPVGVPVLITVVVAVLVGATNWLGRERAT
ncbi:MAG: AzlC family ABC transporter permease [Micrococcales bacterium]|nr:AzlC family ABC transporter permease [Micrococcales bacterium]